MILSSISAVDQEVEFIVYRKIQKYHNNGNVSYDCAYSDETQKWFENYYDIKGRPHRLDGPAMIYYTFNNEIDYCYYYINGKLHNETGPAMIRYEYHYEEMTGGCNRVIATEQYFYKGKRYKEPESFEEQCLKDNWYSYMFKLSVFR